MKVKICFRANENDKGYRKTIKEYNISKVDSVCSQQFKENKPYDIRLIHFNGYHWYVYTNKRIEKILSKYMLKKQ